MWVDVIKGRPEGVIRVGTVAGRGGLGERIINNNVPLIFLFTRFIDNLYSFFSLALCISYGYKYYITHFI